MDSLTFLRLYSQSTEGEPRCEYRPRNVAESNQWASNLRDEMVECYFDHETEQDLRDMIKEYSLPCKDIIDELPKFVAKLGTLKFVCDAKNKALS